MRILLSPSLNVTSLQIFTDYHVDAVVEDDDDDDEDDDDDDVEWTRPGPYAACCDIQRQVNHTPRIFTCCHVCNIHEEAGPTGAITTRCLVVNWTSCFSISDHPELSFFGWLLWSFEVLPWKWPVWPPIFSRSSSLRAELCASLKREPRAREPEWVWYHHLGRNCQSECGIKILEDNLGHNALVSYYVFLEQEHFRLR